MIIPCSVCFLSVLVYNLLVQLAILRCGRLCGCAFKFSVKESWWHRGNSSINFSGTPDYFTSQDQVNMTVQGRISFLSLAFTYQGLCSWMRFMCFTSLLKFDISKTDVLRCSRQNLGIMASTRGAIIGRLRMQVQFPKCEMP